MAMQFKVDIKKQMCEKELAELENKLDEADRAAEHSGIRYSSDDVFDRIRKRIHLQKQI